tara:strand:+ start:1310 stop:1423 length:114 start_codon:yes stop_codon:yes gene_type:complete
MQRDEIVKAFTGVKMKRLLLQLLPALGGLVPYQWSKE